MSTIYKGKLYFTEQELTTKYDKISLNTNFKFNTSNLVDLIPRKSPCFNNQLFNHFINNFSLNDKLKIHQIEDKIQHNEFNNNLLNPALEEWMDLMKCEDIDSYDNFSEVNETMDLSNEICEDCVANNFKSSWIDAIAEEMKEKLLDLVLQSMLYGLKDFSSYATLCSDLVKRDPEFIFKMSLFCRKELNVRSVSNFLLGLAAHLNESRIFLKKYFKVIVNLPTDWMEVVFYYMTVANSSHFPNQLRKSLTNKFMDFSTYQIGKYQNKEKEIELDSKKIKVTLKNLIRILHIHEPVDHVMSLLGKRYPNTNEEFMSSKLPGQWDQTKAGKRMKVPIPETWETQLSIHGNRPEVWEKLIDNKSLPYMATIRNLRNLLQSNVKEHYHAKIAQYICKESNVINGKLLPFQYFTAHKILDEYNESILKAQTKLNNPLIVNRGKRKMSSQKGNDRRDKLRKKIRLQKLSKREIIPEHVIKGYTNALNKAVEIATTYNIPPIKGKVLILADINEEVICPAFKYGTSKSVKEVIGLLISMCFFASENVEIYLVKNLVVSKFTTNPKEKSILGMSTTILSAEHFGTYTPVELVTDMITKLIRFDLILTFDVDLPEPLLLQYSKYVNPAVLIFDNSLIKTAGKSTNLKSENIFHLSGFSEHTLRIISEQNNGNLINRIDSMDDKYNLENIDLIEIKRCKINLENSSSVNSGPTEINIFISSTFMDMHRERSMLNKVIIPAVKRNVSFANNDIVNINCIDLRWGVPPHWGRSEKLLQHCIEQVKRCQIFVCIVGLRYGWVPEPEMIRNLSGMYPELSECEGLSITNIEYKCASSSCHKVILIKSTELDDPFDELESKLFRNELMSNELYYKYSYDALTKDFEVLVPHLTRIISDNILANRQSRLSICRLHKRKFRSSDIVIETGKFLQFCHDNNGLYQKCEIDQIISMLETHLPSHSHRFYELIAASEDKTHSNRIKQLSQHISLHPNDAGGILLIEGMPGSGKTSILSGFLSKFCSATYERDNNLSISRKKLHFVWIYDVIKTLNAEKSNDIYLFDLLYDIVEFLILNLEYDILPRLKKLLEVPSSIGDEDFWKPADLKGAMFVWTSLLAIIDSIKGLKVTLFIDGIEQLKDSAEASTLNWIPLILPAKFRVVLTAVCDSNLSICAKLRKDSLVHRNLPISLIYKKTVIENMLKKHGKSIESVPFNNYMSEFTLKRDSDKPLYLKFAVNHLLLFATFDKIKETILSLPSTLELLIMHSLKCLENEVPREICLVYFTFINSSKIGFRIEDMQMLMSIYFRVASTKHKYQVHTSDLKKLKSASLLPVCFPMYPLIIIKNMSNLLLHENTNGRIIIKDSYVRAVVSRYSTSVDRKIINCIISLYYDGMMSCLNDKIAYRDIIYYKFCATLFEECAHLLTNIKYLKMRFELKVSEGLLDDYMGYGDIGGDIWTDICSRAIWKDFKNFIVNNINFLTQHPDLFIQQAINEPDESFVKKICNEITLVPFGFGDDKISIFKVADSVVNPPKIESISFSMPNRISCATVSLILQLVAIGYENGLIQLCDLSTFQIQLNLRKHVIKVNKICFLKSDESLVSVGEDCKAYVWSSKDGSLLRNLKGHCRPITDCMFSIKSGLIGTTGLDSQFIIWKSDSYSSDHIFKTKSPINCIAKHPVNDIKVIVGCWNGNMIIYNILDHKRIAVLHSGSSVVSVSFHPVFDLFVSSNVAGQVDIWNSKWGVKLKTISNNQKLASSSVRFSSDGMYFVEYGGNNSKFVGANVWSTTVGYYSGMVDLADVTCLDMNLEYLIYGFKSGSVSMTGSKTFTKSICKSELTAISFQDPKSSKNGNFATVDYDRNVYLCQIVKDDIYVTDIVEDIHANPVNVLCYFSNYLISGSEDCSLGIIDIENGQWKESLPSIRNIFLGAILSIDIWDGSILVGSKDNSIGLFSMDNRMLLNHEIQAHNDWIMSVCFVSSDQFVSGSQDCSLKMWKITPPSNNETNFSIDSQTGWNRCANQWTFSILHVLGSHTGPITSISYNNVDFFASSSEDGTIKLWNLTGLFVDNLVLEINYSEKYQKKTPVKWLRFHREKPECLIALDSNSKQHQLNLNRPCLLNSINDHCDPITSVFDCDNGLFTLSIDGSIRRWCLGDLVKKMYTHLDQYTITHALHLSWAAFQSDDVIAAITNSGTIVLFGFDISRGKWKLIDTFDLKPQYYRVAKINICSSPFLLCQSFELTTNKEIIAEFNKTKIYFDVPSLSTKTALAKDSKLIDNSQAIHIRDKMNGESYIDVWENDLSKYVLRFKEDGQFLQLISLKHQSDPIILGTIPLHGTPCHAMIFRNARKEHAIFLAYVQGNVEVLELKQMTVLS